MISEVAKLRERMRLEVESAYQGLYGYAPVTQHQIIRQRMRQIDQTFEQLMPYIGEEAAELILVAGMDVAYQKEKQELAAHKEQLHAGQLKKQQETRASRQQ